MAITNNGVKNSVPAAQVPDDYTRPTITEFADEQLIYDVIFDVDKVTVDDSDAATTMTAIIENVTIGLEKQIEDYVTATFISTQTVTTWADWTALKTNMQPLAKTDDYLTDTITNYECTVKIYIKSVTP